MKSTSESLSHPKTSNGRGTGSNCVVVRRGGEQPELDLWSQTKVNPIRFATAVSLLASGEASGQSHIRFLTHSSYRGGNRAVGGWGTGEPDAGDLQVRFGGGSETNQCPVPTSISMSQNAFSIRL